MKYVIPFLAVLLLLGAGCAPAEVPTQTPDPNVTALPPQQFPPPFEPETELRAAAPEKTDTWVEPILLTTGDGCFTYSGGVATYTGNCDSAKGSGGLGIYTVDVKVLPTAVKKDEFVEVHFYAGTQDLATDSHVRIPPLTLSSFGSENADWFYTKIFLVDGPVLYAEAAGGHEAYPRYYRYVISTDGWWEEMNPWELVKTQHPDTIPPAFTLDVGSTYIRLTEQSGGGYGDSMHTSSPSRDALAQVYILDTSTLAIVDQGTVLRQADRGFFEETAYGAEVVFIRSITPIEFGYELNLEMGTFFGEELNAAKAVREDGLCTSDQYRINGCLSQRPNGFYLRRSQGNLIEFVAGDVPVVLDEVYQPAGAPLRVLLQDFLAMYQADPSWADRPFAAMYQEQFLTKLTEIYIP